MRKIIATTLMLGLVIASPSLVEDFNIDFWENEFLSIVK